MSVRRVVLNGDPPLSVAARWLRNLVGSGEKVSCPCCGQTAKLYPRTINGAMARQLLILLERDDWVYYRDLTTLEKGADKDYAKLKYWGLVDIRDAGYYRITDAGRRFVRGETRVKRVVYVFMDEAHSWSPDEVTFADCLGTPYTPEHT